ncbi:MAG: class I SAM-dependent methyltransferase [Anaerolineae bacterium]|nr:class I SAM-dependent methyltransferase [Anaerolineae bacterium]MCX8068093.1 class I SAM-dependent methyltransferase [Anaerolineae bacterium]MDW7992270.1 class I SAM-dependent methyltransferase [Anaerolineae bacterium]
MPTPDVAQARGCVLCGGPLGEAVFQNVRDRLGISDRLWTFRRCRECGSAVLDPMPSQEELLTAYPDSYSFGQAPRTHPMHHLLHMLEAHLFYAPLYRHSVRQVQRVTGLRRGRLLDVGGGTGYRTVFFQRAGFDCVVLEPDERALRVAQEQFGLKTVSGLLETAELPAGTFDVLTFFAVIEHMPAPLETLKIALRLLRPGGWIVAMVPILAGWQAKLGLRWHQVREAPRHVFLPTVEGMSRLLTAAGFEFRTWEGGNPLDEAGILALSLLPASASAIACAEKRWTLRFGYRLVGAGMTLAALPAAYLAYRLGRSSIGVFFAQKSAQSEGNGSIQRTR